MYDITDVIIGVITLLLALITAFGVPYIKKRCNKEDLEVLKILINNGVEAAEQLLGSGKGKKKKQYVKDFLASNGMTYNETVVDTFIEASVRNLKIVGGEVEK